MYFANKNQTLPYNENFALIPDFKALFEQSIYFNTKVANDGIEIEAIYDGIEKNERNEVKFLFTKDDIRILDFDDYETLGFYIDDNPKFLPAIEAKIREVDQLFYQYGEYDELYTDEQVKKIAQEQFDKINRNLSKISLFARDFDDVLTLNCLAGMIQVISPTLYQILNYQTFEKGDFYFCDNEIHIGELTGRAEYDYEHADMWVEEIECRAAVNSSNQIYGKGLIITDSLSLAVKHDGKDLKIIEAQPVSPEFVNGLKDYLAYTAKNNEIQELEEAKNLIDQRILEEKKKMWQSNFADKKL